MYQRPKSSGTARRNGELLVPRQAAINPAQACRSLCGPTELPSLWFKRAHSGSAPSLRDAYDALVCCLVDGREISASPE